MQIFLKKKIVFLFLYFFTFSYCYGKWQVFREHKTFTEYFEMGSVKKIDDIITSGLCLITKSHRKKKN